MKSRPIFLQITLFLCSLCILLALPLSAQNEAPAPPEALAEFSASLPRRQHLEGFIEATSGGVSSRARVQFQAPDQLRLEIEKNEAAGVRAQVIIAAGDETRLYDPATRRVQRLPYNITRQWWRGANLLFGGPANFVLFGMAPEATAGAYASSVSAAGELTLEAHGEGRKLVSDYVRFGGSGDRIFYAPFKRPVWNRPAKILLRRDAAKSQLVRVEAGDAGQVLSFLITHDAGGWPQTATATDAKNRVAAQWKYSLQPRNEPFPETTFAFDFGRAENALLLEDGLLKSIREYSGNDADSKFNLGVALMRQAEDLPAALAAWEEAARLAPAASAPQLAMYEAALAARDLSRAEAALGKLAALPGIEPFEILWRRAALQVARRDWNGAQASLESAAQAAPDHLPTKLTLADVLRARGDGNGAQAILLALLSGNEGQSSGRVLAAEMLAELSVEDADATLKALPSVTLWQKLARAHIDLQAGQPSTLATDDLHALASLAAGYERAGRDEDTIAAWKKVVERAPTPADTTVRLHLMALHARRGEAMASLQQYRELAAVAPGLKAQREYQDALLIAWRKALRQEQLRDVLEQRSLAANATEDDARLWLAWQENYGTPEQVNAAISNGLGRFDRSAWWRARRAEHIMAQYSQTTDRVVQERLQRDALDAATAAVGLDPEQPYYAIQRAVLLTQRATPITAVIEPGRLDGLRKIAGDTLDGLLQKWPGDPDVQIAVASQRLALETAGTHTDSIALLQTALRGGTPEGEQDRHFISFSSRQMLVSALRRNRKWDELSPQYEILFRSARSADEQLGVALNYVRLLMNREEVDALAAAMIFFAREPWPFEASQQLLQPLVNVIAVKPELHEPVLKVLLNHPDPYGRLTAAYFYSNLLRQARRVATQPEAPLRSERDLDQAVANMAAASKELEPLVQGADKILAGRAAALLGEEAIAATNFAAGAKWLRQAVALEPRDVHLRVALATALLAQGQAPEALVVRRRARQALPANFETVRQLAKLSYKIGQNEDRETAVRLAAQAMSIGQIDPTVTPGIWQAAAIYAARTALDTGRTNSATAIYTGLSSTQWSVVDRAVTLIDWEESLREIGRTEQAAGIAQQLEALELTPQQRYSAEMAWQSLN